MKVDSQRGVLIIEADYPRQDMALPGSLNAVPVGVILETLPF